MPDYTVWVSVYDSAASKCVSNNVHVYILRSVYCEHVLCHVYFLQFELYTDMKSWRDLHALKRMWLVDLLNTGEVRVISCRDAPRYDVHDWTLHRCCEGQRQVAAVWRQTCTYCVMHCTCTLQLYLSWSRVGFGAHVCYHCRISPPRFLAECCKRRLNQGSFVLLFLGCLLFLICI